MKLPGLLLVLLLSLALPACDSPDHAEALAPGWTLFVAPHLERWHEAEMAHSGGFTRETDEFVLKAGSPMTGIVYRHWKADDLPVIDYAISYEARRVQGTDFFGTVTFPVGSVDRCVSFVLGGWGGSQVGISSIDGYDASENPTGSRQTLENDHWYHVRIEVREKSLRVWLDGRPIINTNIAGRQLSMRAGEIDRCMPFGFASFRTEARLRNLRVEKLPVGSRQ
ncbi:family 16 glycoside hydrolase [Verrucomicrobium sp. BvORR106]|uniref:family 16 glycoside hydrolase n=1 Tax=Verrucomicrobium sp. BvORR106 TaxID=1403819 RepID=UPI00068DD0E3|nr:family 16 glycoside hydrolase [Verrucomicrobium sp. BvORR106]